jgi:hypothetical protein
MESPNPREVACYQRTKGPLVEVRRHLGCKTCSFRIWLRAADLQFGLKVGDSGSVCVCPGGGGCFSV